MTDIEIKYIIDYTIEKRSSVLWY